MVITQSHSGHSDLAGTAKEFTRRARRNTATTAGRLILNLTPRSGTHNAAGTQTIHRLTQIKATSSPRLMPLFFICGILCRGIFSSPRCAEMKKSRAWLWRLVLLLPSLWCLLYVPPLWRDTDGFNQIASTFAPKGIIHWLPGYCFFGRLVVIAAGIVASLVSGHGLPYLSIGTPQLSDAGIYTLLLVQHAFLFAALAYLVRTFVDGFWYRLGWSVVLALTPWMYSFANCIGSEAFSNPLVLLVIACGWRCLKAPAFTTGKVAGLFGLLLAACLTRQINLLLASNG